MMMHAVRSLNRPSVHRQVLPSTRHLLSTSAERQKRSHVPPVLERITEVEDDIDMKGKMHADAHSDTADVKSSTLKRALEMEKRMNEVKPPEWMKSAADATVKANMAAGSTVEKTVHKTDETVRTTAHKAERSTAGAIITGIRGVESGVEKVQDAARKAADATIKTAVGEEGLHKTKEKTGDLGHKLNRAAGTGLGAVLEGMSAGVEKTVEAGKAAVVGTKEAAKAHTQADNPADKAKVVAKEAANKTDHAAGQALATGVRGLETTVEKTQEVSGQAAGKVVESTVGADGKETVKAKAEAIGHKLNRAAGDGLGDALRGVEKGIEKGVEVGKTVVNKAKETVGAGK
mmetsp:Transcript_14774/g.43381  ORF Transcript_14774/g.43381 Transcript_14774/m.43381 type:complete len:346 (-) Transcript_14774:266-1303(-)|eukprot:CAMPEP_0206050996 /NCGR_PEP_ID=MMETSP1466-20131121/30478_1 /ASSEMBLY_ACC=CAM_ASM_001126 /TAXON_ID=44452 /ORGANISM="Pavlova gyrans, Strain CCMP608" /LENGTH=345 /DNA_ID=CAMNT_0053426117 /DNA_START=90 /DNA_END=1127 /DNA_ORIENTATION=+